MYMLAPTLGTALIILYARSTFIADKFLANPLLVGVGLISYSAYLWHQPIFSFFRIYSQEPPNELIYIILIAFTFILATLSWFFIEQPFRKKDTISKHTFLISTTFCLSFLLLFGFFTHYTNGFPERIFNLSKFTSKDISIAYGTRNYAFKSDSFEKNDKKKLLVVGRSFARDAINIIRETYDMQHINIVYRNDFNHCNLTTQSNGGRLLEEADIILLAPSYSYNKKCVERLIKRSHELQLSVFFVGIKHFGYNLNWISRINEDQRSFLKNTLLEETKQIEHTAKSFIPNDLYISIIEGLGNGNEILITDEAGHILSPDRRHLTKHGAIFIGKNVFIPSKITQYLPLPSPHQ